MIQGAGIGCKPKTRSSLSLVRNLRDVKADQMPPLSSLGRPSLKSSSTSVTPSGSSTPTSKKNQWNPQDLKNQILRALDVAGIPYRAIPDSLEVALDCPVPGCNKEKKFYVNAVRRVGFCQRCKTGLSWKEICKRFGLPEMHLLREAPSPQDLRDMVPSIFGGRADEEPQTDELLEVELPFGCYPSWRYPKATDYLLTRGLSVELIQEHQLGYCPYGPYAKRIVFPIPWKDKLVGFQTRTIVKLENKDFNYRSMKGFPAGSVLYPEKNLMQGRIILTEGVIPALLYRGLATFGKKLTERQLKVLVGNRYVRQVVLAWDRDAWTGKDGQKAPAIKAWEQIKQYFPCAGIILPKDAPQPDDMNHSAMSWAVEKVWRHNADASHIWDADSSGNVEKVI